MLLVIEVGNTNTGVGVFDGTRLVASWRLTSRREQTADEYGLFVQTLLGTRGISAQDIRGVAISNVVPPVQHPTSSTRLPAKVESDTGYNERNSAITSTCRSRIRPVTVNSPKSWL